jgi:predicted naringenin-chalcone synthase
MRPSAKLVSLATAVPPNVLSQSDVATAANQCFGRAGGMTSSSASHEFSRALEGDVTLTPT